jgi:glycosyltransferase involved in cell wall biosynthesis
MRIGFTMPAYNEERLLGVTVDGTLPLIDRLVIVNDGSTDATGDIAESYAARHPGRVEVIHQRNTGIGGAVVTGMRRLLEHHDLDAFGITASDNQCDPALIPVFKHILETEPNIDVAKGSRFLHPQTLSAMPRFRYWGNRGVTAVMRLILGYHRMSDVLHGYLLGRRRVFEQMEFERIAAGYDLENTMMAEFRRLRCRFGLVPSPSRYGESKSKIVYRTQIPKTIRKVSSVLARRLTSGPLADRLAPFFVATGNLPAAWLAMRLTSPSVRIFPASVVGAVGRSVDAVEPDLGVDGNDAQAAERRRVTAE